MLLTSSSLFSSEWPRKGAYHGWQRTRNQLGHLSGGISSRLGTIYRRATISMLLDEVLEEISEILEKLKPSKLDAYQRTQDLLHKVNVATDASYQKSYIGFYKLRLPTSGAYAQHFAILEKYKTHTSIVLKELLAELRQITGRVEASFGSKLLATIDPNVAPLDRIVLGHLKLSLPLHNHPNRLDACAQIHEELVRKMENLVQDIRFAKVKGAFCGRYPGYRFTDTKILDLILWQHR